MLRGLHATVEYQPNEHSQGPSSFRGKAAVGLDATFEKFAAAFLARYVKAADGRKARAELSEMKNTGVKLWVGGESSR